jgi:hypothetical protein
MADTKKTIEDVWDHRMRLLEAGVPWEQYEACLPEEQPWMSAKSRKYWVHVYRLDLEAQQKRQKP